MLPGGSGTYPVGCRATCQARAPDVSSASRVSISELLGGMDNSMDEGTEASASLGKSSDAIETLASQPGHGLFAEEVP